LSGVLHILRQSEVGYLDLRRCIGGHHDILRFNVAMCNAPAMHIGKGITYLVCQALRFVFFESPESRDIVP